MPNCLWWLSLTYYQPCTYYQHCPILRNVVSHRWLLVESLATWLLTRELSISKDYFGCINTDSPALPENRGRDALLYSELLCLLALARRACDS